MQVSLFFYLFFRRIFAAVGFSFYDIKGYMCFFVCQRDVNPVWVFGDRHFFAANGVPEAELRAEQKIEAVEWFMSIL